jgi:hypothetical protein
MATNTTKAEHFAKLKQLEDQAETARSAEGDALLAAEQARAVAEQHIVRARLAAEQQVLIRNETANVRALLAAADLRENSGSGSRSGGSGSDPDCSSPNVRDTLESDAAHVALATPAAGATGSGATTPRPTPRMPDALEQLFANCIDDVAAESTAAGPHNCFFCDKLSPPNHCGRCKVAFYCDSTCQRSHWPLHKLVCTRFAKRRDVISSGDPAGQH